MSRLSILREYNAFDELIDASQEADLNESIYVVALVEKNLRTVTFRLIFQRNHLKKK